MGELLPAPATHAYPPPRIFNETSSWGGSVMQDDDGVYHMFVAEMAEGFGLNSWGTNSIVAHAVSVTPEGPFERKKVIVDAFSHNPTINRAPDGTWVMWHIGCGTPNKYSKCESCSGGRTGGCPRAHEQVGCTNDTTHVLSARSLDGPWTALNASITNPNGNFNIDNPAPYFFDNGSVLLLGRGGSSKNCRSITAPSWQGPYTLGPLINVHASVEDPFLYRDTRGNFHALFHGYSANSGYHSFSRDGLTWENALPAYNTTVNMSDGTWVTHGRRERPHLLFNAVGEPAFLYTAVTLGNGDKTATHVQEINTRVSPSSLCEWHENVGLHSNDFHTVVVNSKEECCGLCRATSGCAAADFEAQRGNICHLKRDFKPISRRDGSIACVPTIVKVV